MDIEKIHKAIVQRLKNNGCHVEPADVTEGFPKPSYFVEMDYGSIEMVNPFQDDIEIVGSIQYVPKVETKYELLQCQKFLRSILMRNPIKTDEGSICIHKLEFDTSLFPTLVVTFSINITEEVIDDEEYEKFENLDLGGI
ncbi:MAG: hypothetical protein MRZ66_00170 [Clostridiales bacterium]|nr:hypothetical protein [Clostridiales bacterium]